MTIHLQETAENEFGLRLVKIKKLPSTSRGRVLNSTPLVRVFNSERPLEDSELLLRQKNNKWREKNGLKPLPLTHSLYRSLDSHEFNKVWLVNEIEVINPGANPTVRVALWNEESQGIEIFVKWNEIDSVLECYDEKPPTKEKGRIYDVKRR